MYDRNSPEIYNWNHLGRNYFSYLECIYNTWNVYNNKLTIQAKTKVVGRKYIIQLTGVGAYSSTYF